MSYDRKAWSKTVDSRFWRYVSFDESGCWVWIGMKVGHSEYGRFRAAKRAHYAHRWGYERYVGPIPEGLELDHLCRNRACVRFDHLEPVSHRENTRRGTGPTAVNARKTHCPQGHPYDDENTLWTKDRRRMCLSCHRAHGLATYHRLYSAAAKRER